MSDEELLNSLKNPFSPFIWGVFELRNKGRRVNFVELLEDKLENAAHDSFKSFCLALVLYLDHVAEEGLGTGKKWLAKCEELLADGAEDRTIAPYRLSLILILYNCKAHEAILAGRRSAAESFLEDMQKFDDLSPDMQSAVMAVKASVLQEYGLEGCLKGLEAAREAVSKCGKEWSWQLLLGQISSRLRYYDRILVEPSQEEMSSLKQAYALNKNSETALALADCYKDIAYAIYSETASFDREALSFNKRKAFKLYCEADELNNEKRLDLTLRCAEGLNWIPGNIGNKEYAVKLTTQVLTKLPDHPEARHIDSVLKDKLKKTSQYEKPKRKNLGNELSRIERLAKVEGEDPMPSFEQLLDESASGSQTRLIICLELAGYLLAVKKSVLSALHYLTLALQINPKFKAIEAYRLRWIEPATTVDMVATVVEAAEEALEERRYDGCEEAGKIVEAIYQIRKLAQRPGGLSRNKNKKRAKLPVTVSKKPVPPPNATKEPTQNDEKAARLRLDRLLRECEIRNRSHSMPIESQDASDIFQRLSMKLKDLSIN